jgi:bacillithiol system protein YtxJ
MYVKCENVEDLPEDCIVFKHSNTCPVSARAKMEMDKLEEENIQLLVVQDEPDLKWAIADKYNIKHESPQVLIIKEGKVVKVFNHNQITAEAISNV